MSGTGDASGVIENLYLKFGSNATELKKGNEEAKQSTDKLEKSLKNTESTTTKVGASFMGAVRQFGSAITALASVGAIIAGITSAAIYTHELEKLSTAIGVNVSLLDVWGSAVESVGGSASEFQGTLKNLYASLSEVDINGFRPGVRLFQMYGIQVTDTHGRLKNLISILPSLADLFSTLSKTQALNYGKKLGLDEGTVQLLQRGRKEIEAIITRQKELGFVTKEDAEVAKKFNQQWGDTAHAFRSLFTVVNTMVLPSFTAILKGIEGIAVFMRKHKDFIIGALIGIGATALYFTVPAVLAAIAPFGLLALAIGGVILAVALLYDDIQAFRKGNASVIGDVVKSWNDASGAIEKFKLILSSFGDIFGSHTDSGMLGYLYDLSASILSFPLSYLRGIVDLFKALYQLGSMVSGLFSFGDKDFNKMMGEVNKIAVEAGATPLNSQTNSSIINSSSPFNKSITVQTGPITIQSQATDAAGISRDLGLSLQDQLKIMLNSTADGRLA